MGAPLPYPRRARLQRGHQPGLRLGREGLRGGLGRHPGHQPHGGVRRRAGLRPPAHLRGEDGDPIPPTTPGGAFAPARPSARRLISEERPGSIVLVGSINSVVGDPRLVAYTASKAGLAGMSKTLSLDWARHNIRVNTVAPGYVATDLTSGLQQNEGLRRSITDRTPLDRMAKPAEIADLVVFLASDISSFITGAVYPLDGGWTTW